MRREQKINTVFSTPASSRRLNPLLTSEANELFRCRDYVFHKPIPDAGLQQYQRIGLNAKWRKVLPILTWMRFDSCSRGSDFLVFQDFTESWWGIDWDVLIARVGVGSEKTRSCSFVVVLVLVLGFLKNCYVVVLAVFAVAVLGFWKKTLPCGCCCYYVFFLLRRIATVLCLFGVNRENITLKISSGFIKNPLLLINFVVYIHECWFLWDNLLDPISRFCGMINLWI